MTLHPSPSPRAAATDLQARVTGPVLAPGDDGYDAGRALYYAGLDRRPAVVVRPADAADVAATVRFAATEGVPLTVRSGGHGLLGTAVADDAIVLDLSSLDDLTIDPADRTAWAGAGLTAGAYTRRAAEHGLATGFGDSGTVGIGGITLGGGVGLLARRHGLTIDSLLAAEVVTADGRVRVVDEHTDPDLFWAVRGGAGNVGVVTRFRFRLHEVSDVLGGLLVLPATAEVVAGFVAAAEAAPEEVSTIANVTLQAPPLPFLPEEVHGRPAIIALVVHAGTGEAADRAVAPFRELATPLADMLEETTYAALFPEDEEALAFRVVGDTRFVDAVDLDLARTALDGLRSATSLTAVVQLRVLGGAVARVPADATAYAHRQRRIMLNVAAMYEDPFEVDTHRNWVEALVDRLAGGDPARYVNFVGTNGDHEAARGAWPGATWDRLVAIKRRHDPDHLFHGALDVPLEG